MDQKILSKAIAAYGEERQIMQAMEEMAELTQALSKHCRGFKSNVAEELCDVEIMLEQMKMIFKCHNEVERHKTHKLSRLNYRADKKLKGMDKNECC